MSIDIHPLWGSKRKNQGEVIVLMCLNCGTYSSESGPLHLESCVDPVIVEIPSKKLGMCCLGCGRRFDSEPAESEECCGLRHFATVYEHPNAALIDLIVDVRRKR